MTASRKVKVEFSWHILPKLEQLPPNLRALFSTSIQGRGIHFPRTSFLAGLFQSFMLNLQLKTIEIFA